MARSLLADGPAGSCLYLYGITLNTADLASVVPAPLELITTERLAAWVERLTAEQCSSEVIDGKLRSIEQAGALARAHERMLEFAMTLGPVFPARLYTLFSGPEALQAYLSRNERCLLSVLERLRGRREWGLKLYYAATAPDCELLGTVQRRERIDRMMRAVLGSLTPLAAQLRLKPCFPLHVSERTQALVLNLSLLVDISAEAAFNTEVTRLAAQQELDGFAFQLSGPWPPYSFCDAQ